MADGADDVLFTALSVAHILIWAFVLLAWVHPRTAALNLTVVIPTIYALHMLPFHVLNSAKARMHPDTWQQDVERVEDALVLPDLVDRLRDSMDASFANPLSAQGLLILGAITSGWRLLL